jgi:hypothetical protein
VEGAKWWKKISYWRSTKVKRKISEWGRTKQNEKRKSQVRGSRKVEKKIS